MANIVVGVTGGIAAYKSASLIRLFSEAGHDVKVVVTRNALRFIGETTLEALAKSKVQVVDPDLFTDVDQVKHIALAKQADLFVVAPATASFIAKASAGIADDLLTTTFLATKAPVVIAPAMHTEMWENQATRENISTLKNRGVIVIEPGVGRLTGEDTGVGRLADTTDIFSACLLHLQGPLSGKRVLVTTGGTREPIDSVRYIGNYSSGKQGIAFARSAQLLGAKVQVIAANVEQPLLAGFDTTHVATTAELQGALAQARDNFDILVMAAAVSDFRSAQVRNGKISRRDTGEQLDLHLVPNLDLLAEFTSSLGGQRSLKTIIGFAAEASADLETQARTKLAQKNCDFVVANDISGGQVFGMDDNSIILVDQNTSKEIAGTKLEVANAVWSIVATKLRKS